MIEISKEELGHLAVMWNKAYGIDEATVAMICQDIIQKPKLPKR